ncbi:MaoC family dehydratase [Pontibaca salina]|uniref:MaoC family dehydratase n=1 Tax=Pontibaca salina TaxID=2795731 RepID=A0A934HUX0_9RHOB|nr:MaoC family dehydratase [Pontibaca salina]MBI6629994.1 MaoC family dehydratase [Pontibaca salina]
MKLDLRARWIPVQAEFDRFAELSGDNNPIHVDPLFSAQGGFGLTAAHGMLIYARLWAMLQGKKPTLRHLHQSIIFPNPAFAGEPLDLRVAGDVPGETTLGAVRVADGVAVFLGVAEVIC